jgi:hypothetical protein
MHKNEGILHAIQSLAGVYIYDYLPDERIRQRINQHYAMADHYFSKLLNATESRKPGKGQEVITMTVLLSMQDVRIIIVLPYLLSCCAAFIINKLTHL